MATTLNHRTSNLGSIIANHRDSILAGWLRDMIGSTRRGDLIKESELQMQCQRFLSLLAQATAQSSNTQAEVYDPLREMLMETSRTRALQGFSSKETATFIFSIKQPLFAAIRESLGKDATAMADEMWLTTEIIDGLGLYTTEAYIKTREDTIRRQQEEMLELSTPVVKLWEGILALPLIGTLDSARTQVVMESLLEAIVQTNSKVAIIDITGVPTVDTVVAQHLLKTVTAARLMGAECIISGVRPQIAQTIVHLGINLLDITTKATLSDAFSIALQRTGFKFIRPQKREFSEEKEK
ncbi:MAG TPA: STAS domain-containing protein [Verrucomicrobiae bacterium]|jgi:rsbT co-antagonist protein RsbR|nr:STAS domain-containing protein [Verrucomicrobiae bacterium]